MTGFGKALIGGFILLFVAAFVIWIYIAFGDDAQSVSRTSDDETQTDTRATTTSFEIETIAENLIVPWDLVVLPQGDILVTERAGTVTNISTGQGIFIDEVTETGEGGLLGIVLHPDFEQNSYIYLYHTTEVEGGLENRVVRYVYENDTLTFDRVILSNLPGAQYHDGGRIEFGPDGYLWVTVGDATNEDEAQSMSSYAGTILRLNADGSVPVDSPYSNGVYSYGHRNPQGLTWDERGRLWSTEHGRSGLLSGMDEINRIVAQGNYGWPEIEGGETQPGMISPVAHSGAAVTWAPASAAYWDGSIFFGGLRGEALYEAVLDGDKVIEIHEHLSGEYGRLRTVYIHSDGFMYITTSNRDGRGDPTSTDDRVLKLDPQMFRQ